MRAASQSSAFAGWERTHQVHEEFVGIYSVPQIDAWTTTTVMTDVFFRLNLHLNKF